MADYLSNQVHLKDFYTFNPDFEGLEKAIKSRHFSAENRKILHQELLAQYEKTETSEETLKNIALLQHSDTFTITTGHQLSLFTGPLFFIYKILSVIKLCAQLKEKFPDKNFVPIYWMASEDHDFEEVNHFHLFGKKIEWKTTQSGAVGRFNLENINPIFEEIKEDLPQFRKAYNEKNTLGKATFQIVNELFKLFGLVIIEPDNAQLKSLFKTHIVSELLQQNSFQEIEKTSKKLSDCGYKVQAHPREINLFYIDEQKRERIIFENNAYEINNSNLKFSKEEMLLMAERFPEKLSPNAVFRPQYQETILPNIAYVGGPGELAYWFQLKSSFEKNNTFFPALILRDSFMIVNPSQQKVIEKLQINISDIFKSYDDLKKDLISLWNNSEISLKNEISEMEKIINSIKINTNDKSLHPAIDSEFQRIKKGMESLGKRIQKSEEQIHETALQQLKKLQEKLFPNGEPQERIENVLNYLVNDKDFIYKIYAFAEPLNANLKIIYL